VVKAALSGKSESVKTSIYWEERRKERRKVDLENSNKSAKWPV
jgi:hypothetical protein